MRSWLETLPKGKGGAAAFETGFKLSPGSAAGTILKTLKDLGYEPIARKERFLVKGTYGPLREGKSSGPKPGAPRWQMESLENERNFRPGICHPG